MNKNITCVKCDKLLAGKQTMYCSTICKNNSLQSYEAQQARGLARKRSLVEKFGGHCLVCGYGKNSSALAFHHTNPKEKSFQLDLRALSNRRQARIDEEIAKCILVCNNCHAEIHNPQHNLESTS